MVWEDKSFLCSHAESSIEKKHLDSHEPIQVKCKMLIMSEIYSSSWYFNIFVKK